MANSVCQICKSGDDEASMLLCGDGVTGCNHGFHMRCLNPPLSAMPEGDWFCTACLQKARRGSSGEDPGDMNEEKIQEWIDSMLRDARLQGWRFTGHTTPGGAIIKTWISPSGTRFRSLKTALECLGVAPDKRRNGGGGKSRFVAKQPGKYAPPPSPTPREKAAESIYRQAKTCVARMVRVLDKFGFSKPVPLDCFPDYLEECPSPQDFGTIAARLNARAAVTDGGYIVDGGAVDFDALGRDLDLVCANAMAYNPAPAEGEEGEAGDPYVEARKLRPQLATEIARLVARAQELHLNADILNTASLGTSVVKSPERGSTSTGPGMDLSCRIRVNLNSRAVQLWVRSSSGRALVVDKPPRPLRAPKRARAAARSVSTSAPPKRVRGVKPDPTAPVLPGVVQLGKEMLSSTRYFPGQPRTVPGFSPKSRVAVVAMKGFAPECRSEAAVALQRDGFVLLRGLLDPESVAAATRAVRGAAKRAQLPMAVPPKKKGQRNKPLGQVVIDVVAQKVVTGPVGNAEGSANTWKALSKHPALQRIFRAPELFAAAGAYINEEEVVAPPRPLSPPPSPPSVPPPPTPPRTVSVSPRASEEEQDEAANLGGSLRTAGASPTTAAVRTKVSALHEGRFIRIKPPGAAIEAHADWFHWWTYRASCVDMKCLRPYTAPPAASPGSSALRASATAVAARTAATMAAAAAAGGSAASTVDGLAAAAAAAAVTPAAGGAAEGAEGAAGAEGVGSVESAGGARWQQGKKNAKESTFAPCIDIELLKDSDFPADYDASNDEVTDDPDQRFFTFWIPLGPFASEAAAETGAPVDAAQSGRSETAGNERFGPLACLRASHALPVVSKVLRPRKIAGRELTSALKQAAPGDHEWCVAAALRAGDVVMYDARTVHADCSNTSAASPQLALDCRYIVD